MLLGSELPAALLSYRQLLMACLRYVSQGSQLDFERHIAIIGYQLTSAASNGDISKLSFHISAGSL